MRPQDGSVGIEPHHPRSMIGPAMNGELLEEVGTTNPVTFTSCRPGRATCWRQRTARRSGCRCASPAARSEGRPRGYPAGPALFRSSPGSAPPPWGRMRRRPRRSHRGQSSLRPGTRTHSWRFHPHRKSSSSVPPGRPGRKLAASHQQKPTRTRSLAIPVGQAEDGICPWRACSARQVGLGLPRRERQPPSRRRRDVQAFGTD
jgi:hypothetical protein